LKALLGNLTHLHRLWAFETSRGVLSIAGSLRLAFVSGLDINAAFAGVSQALIGRPVAINPSRGRSGKQARTAVRLSVRAHLLQVHAEPSGTQDSRARVRHC
jgi:hypothetical protein